MPPTPKQLNYLKALANGTGQTFAWPTTRQGASQEIRRLRATRTDHLERRIEREHTIDNIGVELGDASRVTEHEITGWGSTATWSQRS